MTTKKKEMVKFLKDDRDMIPKKTMYERDGEKYLREPGYLYFIAKDGYVWAAPMKHNKTGKKKKVGTVKHERPNILDITDKGGFVVKAKMKNA